MPLARYVARVGTYARGAMKKNETKHQRERL
jgi:hypothetical protein